MMAQNSENINMCHIWYIWLKANGAPPFLVFDVIFFCCLYRYIFFRNFYCLGWCTLYLGTPLFALGPNFPGSNLPSTIHKEMKCGIGRSGQQKKKFKWVSDYVVTLGRGAKKRRPPFHTTLHFYIWYYNKTTSEPWWAGHHHVFTRGSL